MKKLGLFRKFSLTATVVLLCLAIMITCFTFIMPSIGSPLAETSGSSTSDKIDVANNVNIEKECKYGEKFDVPNSANATVTAPDGNPVTVVDGKVEALQVGNYTVTYKNADGDVSYDFYVRVKLDKEYFLKIDFNGADIPSYIQVNKSIELPQAQIVYYDDNKILQPYPGEYTVEVTNSRDSKSINVSKKDNVAAAERKFDVGATVGRVFLTYTAKIGGENGTKYFSKTFTVNVQSNVPNTGNPTLSVSGVQRDASVKRAVTLPKATAADSYDDNVKIVIEVTHEGEKVRNVDIDENGYAYRQEGKEYAEVIFDNDQAMTFYPMEKGTYKITYTAYNDAYDGKGSVGKSSTREYFLTVSDLVAPVFKSVEEWRIPETWGVNVVKGDGNGGETSATDLGNRITFTVPEVVDNFDHAYPDPTLEKDENLISVYFRITDADNSKTIVEFSNILADDKSDACKFKANSVYAKDAVFNKDNPFTFEFDQYKKVDSDGTEVSRPGAYTVLYRARDKANNTSSKTYTVTLQETYKDVAAPTTAKVTVPDYISAADKTLTLPYASYADASDSRPKVDYRVYTDATLGEKDARFIEIDGGEIADLENGYLVINKDKSNEKKLKLGTNLYFYVGVTDKVGNFKSNVEDNADLAAIDDSADETYKNTEAKVKVIGESGMFTYNGDTMTFTNVTPNKTETELQEFVAGDTVSASGFKIVTANLDMRNYTGFEVTVRDPNNNVLANTLETVSQPSVDNATIYVQNIRFNATVPTEADEFYTLTVRVFDVNGNNEVYGYKFSGVKSASLNDNTTSATTIGPNGDVNVSYQLNNDVIKQLPSDGEYRVVRKINGYAFSLMGNEFTAKATGSYTVYDGYIKADAITESGFDYEKDVKPVGINGGATNFNIKDNSSPVIEVQGVMPTYWDKYKENGTPEEKEKTTVKLPSVVAYTENGVADVKVEVTFGGAPIEYDEETRSFKGTKDGTYVVKYTATASNSNTAEASYNINVGDVEGPEFTLSGGTSTNVTMKVGDEFTFAKMELVKKEDGVQITKTLKDPSKEEVTDATVSGSYGSNADKKNNGTKIKFTMAGTYEVIYTAKDSVGNPTTQRYTITVVSSGSSTPTTWTTLSTVLIVIAIVLLAGVIVYVVRFRKVKR